MSDLERKLLARLVDAPDVVSEAHDQGVRAEVFEEPLYQAVWNFTVEYWQNSKRKAAPTAWGLQQEFPGYEVMDDSTDTTDYLCALLRRRFVTNGLQRMMMKATETMANDPVGTLKSLHASAYEASEIATPRVTRTNMADTIEQRREAYAKLEEFPQGIGIPYGFDLMDLHTGGLLPGELAIVGAYAKVGKTMLGLHAASMMVRKGYKPLIYTLEMSLKEIEKRLDAMFSGVSYNRLIHGHLKDDELKQLHNGQEELRDLGGIQIEKPDEGDRTVAHLMSRARQFEASWVFIDQLSHMEPAKSTNDLKEHHGTIVKALSTNIGRAGQEIPVMLAAQFRRDEEEISIQSFANAAEIEREGDILIGLSRNKDLYDNNLMRMEILGARRGARTAYLLNWELSQKTEFKIDKQI